MVCKRASASSSADEIIAPLVHDCERSPGRHLVQRFEGLALLRFCRLARPLVD